MRAFSCSMVLAATFSCWFWSQSANAQGGGKGIGRIVSEAARSGLRGQELADEIKRLQAANGIGRNNGGGPPAGKGPGAKGGGLPAGKGRGAKRGGPPAGKRPGAKGGGPPAGKVRGAKGGAVDEADIVERELEAFIEGEERRLEALLEALATAPDAAKPGIQRAIEAADVNMNDTRELMRRLREGKGRPDAKRGGPPAGKGKDARVGPPAGKGPGAKRGGPPAGKGPGPRGGRAF